VNQYINIGVVERNEIRERHLYVNRDVEVASPTPRSGASPYVKVIGGWAIPLGPTSDTATKVES